MNTTSNRRWTLSVIVRSYHAADAPAPTDPAALTFLTMTTKPSFRAEYAKAAGGKTAVYMARWVNTRGEKGPWSEIATAAVAA
jgi:hypothetical protein